MPSNRDYLTFLFVFSSFMNQPPVVSTPPMPRVKNSISPTSAGLLQKFANDEGLINYTYNACLTNYTYGNNPYKQFPLASRGAFKDRSYQNAAIVKQARKFAKWDYEHLEKVINNIFNYYREWLSSIAPKNLLEIKDYILKVAELVPLREVAAKGNGYCSEATANTIVNSIKSQLENKNRYSIQLVEILAGSGALLGPKEGHALTILKAGPVKFELENRTNFSSFVRYKIPAGQFEELWKKWALQNQEAEVCDDWLGYEGNPDAWLYSFFNHQEFYQYEEKWDSVRVIDYSIPTMRYKKDGPNWQQRKFFLNLLQEIVNINNSHTYTLDPNHFDDTQFRP